MPALLPYVLSTTVSGVPHCIQCNVEERKFDLVPVRSDSELGRVYVSPTKTDAVNVLNWINKHDRSLARRKLEVSPEASIR
jgi:hypothetical protein